MKLDLAAIRAHIRFGFDIDRYAPIGAVSTFVSSYEPDVYAEARRLLRVALAAVRKDKR